jgi:hypothetical protein
MKSESVSKRQREQDLPQSTEVVVDEAAGMIRNVKLLGLESAWGNVYPVEVIERSIRQYEGAPCYLNHGGNEIRPVQELYGTICGVRMTESGPRGDIRYNPALPLSPGIVWWAKNEPARLSMSHDAQLKGTRTKEGKFLVEEIQKVYSVDIVTRGATTSGFKESHPGSKRKRAMEDYSMNPADPAAPAAESAADEATDYISHLCNSLMALLKDPGMDAGEKKKKAKAIIKLALDEGGAGDGSDTTTATEGDDMKDDKVKESLRILMDSTDPNVKRVLEAYDRLSCVRRGHEARFQRGGTGEGFAEARRHRHLPPPARIRSRRRHPAEAGAGPPHPRRCPHAHQCRPGPAADGWWAGAGGGGQAGTSGGQDRQGQESRGGAGGHRRVASLLRKQGETNQGGRRYRRPPPQGRPE